MRSWKMLVFSQEQRISFSLKEFRLNFLKPSKINHYKTTSKDTPRELDRLINQFDRKIKGLPILNEKMKLEYLKKIESFKIKLIGEKFFCSKIDAFISFRHFVIFGLRSPIKRGKRKIRIIDGYEFIETYSYKEFKSSGMVSLFKYNRHESKYFYLEKIKEMHKKGNCIIPNCLVK